MFTGLSAFPLTPLRNDSVDEASFTQTIERLVAAGTDSITALGSTGSYAYLSEVERARVAHLAVEHAGSTPVFIGVGALRTSQVIAYIRQAEHAGAAAVMLPPMSYQRLTDDDVFELFHAETESTDLPVIVYDNPGTTHFEFSLDLYGRIAALPGIASIKIPGVPTRLEDAQAHMQAIRQVIPSYVTIGVSGDATAATGLNAGCDAWYSVIGGTLPKLAMGLTHPGSDDATASRLAESARLDPLWNLFQEFGGSLRVVAAIAEQLNWVPEQCLPLPIQGLNASQRARVTQVMHDLVLTE